MPPGAAGEPFTRPTPQGGTHRPTLPPSWEGFLEAGLVACFLLMLSIFSSPRTRCCSSSGRFCSGQKKGAWRVCAPAWHVSLLPALPFCHTLSQHPPQQLSPVEIGAAPLRNLSFSGK